MRQQMARRIVMRILNRIDVLRDVLVALSPSPAWSDFVLAPRYRFGLSWLVVRPYVWLLRLAGMFGRPVRAAEAGSQLLALPVATGDILLLADSTWSSTNVWPSVAEFRHRGGRVAMVVYDLIPMSHPQYYNRVVVNAYSRWIRGSLPFVDFYACISRFTERELLAHLQGLGGGESRTPPCTGYFHLGSDLDLISAQGTPSQEVRDLAASGGPMFLAVGSLEPRKNIAFILDAFDRVWARMPDASLVIVGHNAWKIDKLIDRIRQHPRYGCGLHWLRDASDTDLEFLYAHSNALIFASVIEGFGLPIVEAMQRGLPVLCSDIPVFREIADGKAKLFSLATTDELVAAVARVASEQANGTAPERRPIHGQAGEKAPTFFSTCSPSTFNPNRASGTEHAGSVRCVDPGARSIAAAGAQRHLPLCRQPVAGTHRDRRLRTVADQLRLQPRRRRHRRISRGARSAVRSAAHAQPGGSSRRRGPARRLAPLRPGRWRAHCALRCPAQTAPTG
ncbi:MAG: glycosyltransferase family 4 protein [Sulfuritalea sp.]|nr:glycosyltransferase family 4 protein [Sulfuritalea sp.]